MKVQPRPTCMERQARGSNLAYLEWLIRVTKTGLVRVRHHPLEVILGPGCTSSCLSVHKLRAG